MDHSTSQIQLLGYCELDKNAIQQKFNQNGVSELVNLSGNYTIVIENNQETYIITSPYCVCQYYYTIKDNQLFHDQTLLGVLKNSQIDWSWNWQSFADLILLDHTLELDTLHPDIHRVSSGSILHFKQGKLNISSLSWEELNPPKPTSAQQAVNTFNQEVEAWITDDVVVSMSGGFDSRLILGSVLKLGYKPPLVTMGYEESTDVVIAKQIANHFGLDLSLVNLNFEDYFKFGQTISALTNGTKSSRHWHTYVYTYQAQLDHNQLMYIGTNGGFAKNFYYDKGILAIYKNMTASIPTLHQLWKGRLKPFFTPDELQQITPELVKEFSEDKKQQRIERLTQLSHNQLLGGLERFYLEQRVQNFMSNGMRLYSENINWCAPFMSREWVRDIWNLKRKWRLGNNWHRYAIQQTYPELMNFPEQGEFSNKMYSKAPLFYWKHKRKTAPIVSYAKYPQWFQQDFVKEFIFDNQELLSNWITPKAIQSIFTDHINTGKRTNTVAFLVTQIFWQMNLNTISKKSFNR
jgi:asparagine synthase (glutamine-hydrolysing)